MVVVVLAVLVAAVVAGVTVRARLDARGYSTTYGATVVHYSLGSKVVGHDLAEIAIVPPGGGVRPLLVLLHGRHDPSRLSWLIPSRTGPESMLSNSLFVGLAKLGRLAPVIVLLDGGGHSYFHNRADGDWGSMILDEAIPDAQRRFGTRPGLVAIGGVSMGGFGALHLAALRPQEFCAIGGHSAALWESASATAPGAFDNATDFERTDVFSAARRGAFDHATLWIDGGTNDPFRAADASLAGLLRARGVKVAYHLWPGGHTQSYWDSHYLGYLRFYGNVLDTCGRRMAVERLPAVDGERTWATLPTQLSNGDGSFLVGGLDGTGAGRTPAGHIDWISWTRSEAIAWGIGWNKCFDAKGCPKSYFLDSQRSFIVRFSKPVNGNFTLERWSANTCWRTGPPNWLGVLDSCPPGA